MGVGFEVFPPEPPELVLPEDTLDIEITECGLLLLRQVSTTGPAIEFRNLGTATAETKRLQNGEGVEGGAVKTDL